MPRPSRADEAGSLYHALNRGNARAAIFCKEADYQAFERILAQGLERYNVHLLALQLMPNHWHFVLRPNRDGEMSRFLRWVGLELTLRARSRPPGSIPGQNSQQRVLTPLISSIDCSRTPHSALRIPHSAFRTPHSAHCGAGRRSSAKR